MKQLWYSPKKFFTFFGRQFTFNKVWALCKWINGQPYSPSVNHCVNHKFRPDGHREPHDGAGSLSPNESLMRVDQGPFRFIYKALIHKAKKKKKNSKEPALWLTLSRRRSLSYRNQSVYFLSKSIDWFLYNRDLRRKRVKIHWWCIYNIRWI